MLVVWSDRQQHPRTLKKGCREKRRTATIAPREASALRSQLLWDFPICPFPGFSTDCMYPGQKN